MEEYIRAGADAALERLKRLCAQPSVSAQGLGIHPCAQLVRAMLEELGATVSMTPAPENGYPVIYGEIRGRSERTVLFYDHYDVQPPEPLELWSSPPFEPTVRDGKLYGRGVSDDKGSIAVRLAAIEAYVRTGVGLPCTVKFFLEGEEEIGSPHLAEVVRDHAHLLKADGCIWEGGGVNWEGDPLLSLGLKGILYVELVARGPSRDVHSSYAAVVPSPVWRLTWALATIKSSKEEILIPGFYDTVRPLTPAEQDALRRIPPEEGQLLESLGLTAFVNRARGFEYQRRLQTEPTCNICGIISGYTGPGVKTVLPNEARVKLDFRLVPEQDPQDIVSKLRAHLDAQGFQDVEIASWDGEPAARTSLDHPWAGMVADAASISYGREAVIAPSMAGSGPMHLFTHALGLPVSTGCGLSHPDNRIHAPDENIRIEDVVKGVLHTAELLDRLGNAGGQVVR
ncbi:MAG: M20/M25/M40 family metallo-hydrolase [Chloroflexi bacterium]|nr:M20/M25/M40 family metallo-hydrolase [Chloroflexota bacterium]